MKAEIELNGKMTITPENKQEQYTLKRWNQEYSENKEGVIVECDYDIIVYQKKETGNYIYEECMGK